MELKLYYFENCPYCQIVLKNIQRLKIESKIKMVDIQASNQNFQERINLNFGGKQVPCLLIDGKPMLESSDINRFLEDQFSS